MLSAFLMERLEVNDMIELKDLLKEDEAIVEHHLHNKAFKGITYKVKLVISDEYDEYIVYAHSKEEAEQIVRCKFGNWRNIVSLYPSYVVGSILVLIVSNHIVIYCSNVKLAARVKEML